MSTGTASLEVFDENGTEFSYFKNIYTNIPTQGEIFNVIRDMNTESDTQEFLIELIAQHELRTIEEINDLKTKLNSTQSTLDSTNLEKDSMALFGMQMSKSGYNVLLWSIIAGLLALLLFFIYKYKNSNSITKNVNLALAEIEEEFEEHRKVALEREQKVRRQLQDELNKQKPNS